MSTGDGNIVIELPSSCFEQSGQNSHQQENASMNHIEIIERRDFGDKKK